MEIKQWIKGNLFDSIGRINSRRVSNSGAWIKTNHPEKHNIIFQLTSFLNKDMPIRQRLYHVYNDMLYLSKCEVCNNTTTFYNFNIGYKRFCSLVCRTKGTEEKRRNTCIDRYGTGRAAQNKKIIKKIKQTCMKKYGVENYTQTKEHKNSVRLKRLSETPKQKQLRDDRHRESCIKNYGNGNQTNNKKRKQTNIERYGVDSYSKTKEFKEKYIRSREKKFKLHILPKILTKIENDGNIIIDGDVNNIRDKIKIKCNKGHIFSRIVNNLSYNTICPLCNNNKSKSETLIYDFLSEYDIHAITNSRSIISPLELDIYISSHNLAIELNGLYWHSETNGKDRNYHLDKTELCNKQNIQLLHITDSEWLYKQKIVKSVILSKLGIYKHKYYARKCYIKEIDSNIKNKFLEDNHLQGQDRSFIKLGLYHDNDLLSVMTFGNRKITGGSSKFELIRYCNKLNIQVVGGASKLFKYFINNYEYDNIVTYADRRWSNGQLYKKLGFEFKHHSKPNYWYFKLPDNRLYHRVGFQKHKLKDKLDNFDPNLTEYQNMLNNGWNRIWDCGNFVFGYK